MEQASSFQVTWRHKRIARSLWDAVKAHDRLRNAVCHAVLISGLEERSKASDRSSELCQKADQAWETLIFERNRPREILDRHPQVASVWLSGDLPDLEAFVASLPQEQSEQSEQHRQTSTLIKEFVADVRLTLRCLSERGEAPDRHPAYYRYLIDVTFDECMHLAEYIGYSLKRHFRRTQETRRAWHLSQLIDYATTHQDMRPRPMPDFTDVRQASKEATTVWVSGGGSYGITPQSGKLNNDFWGELQYFTDTTVPLRKWIRSQKRRRQNELDGLPAEHPVSDITLEQVRALLVFPDTFPSDVSARAGRILERLDKIAALDAQISALEAESGPGGSQAAAKTAEGESGSGLRA